MFGILSRRRRTASTSRPVNRSRLQCEQLGDRVNPSLTMDFTADIWGVSGQFTYDELSVDPSEPVQVIDFNNLWFNSSFGMFTADEDPVEAEFRYGLFHSMEFGATAANPEVPHLNVDVLGFTATIEVESGPTYTSYINLQAVTKGATLDFANVTTGQAYQLRIQGYDGNTKMDETVVEITAAATAADITNAVKLALEQLGYTVTRDGTKLSIIPPKASRTKITFQTQTPPNTNVNLNGPSLIIAWGNPAYDVWVNGNKLSF